MRLFIWTDQSGRDSAVLIRRPRKNGVDDHSRHARFDVLIGSFPAIGSSRRERLLEADGANRSESAQVVLVSPHSREQFLGSVKLGYGFENGLL